MTAGPTLSNNFVSINSRRLLFGSFIITPLAIYFIRTGNRLPGDLGQRWEETLAALSPAVEGAARGTSLHPFLQSLQHRLSLPSSPFTFVPAFLCELRSFSTSTISFIAEHIHQVEPDFEHLVRQLHHLWVLHQRFPRPATITIAAVIPFTFALLARGYPESSLAAHRVLFLTALCLLVLAGVWAQTRRVEDVLLIAAAMTVFEILRGILFKRPSYRGVIVGESPDQTASKTQAEEKMESHHHENTPATPETGMQTARNRKCQSFDATSLRGDLESKDNEKFPSPRRRHSEAGPAVADQASADKSAVNDEVRKIRQAMARDHQVVIYRKDIELFALRKALQHKEDQIRDREAQLEEAYRQHRIALEQKDTWARALKDRNGSYETIDHGRNEDAIRDDDSNDEHHAAVQVRLLHVKGRNSQEHDRLMEEKDLEIVRLRQELAIFHNGSEGVKSLQEELRRAWSCTQETQNALIEERKGHTKTKHKLQEMAIRLEEELRKSQKNSPSRLPTIEESDKQELEAMFNAAQEDNLRLHSEREVLEKRLREANGRVFTAQQELESLREQLRHEKDVHADMEMARPSLVHRVHFQRLEGQLKEVHNLLQEKDHQLQHVMETSSAQKQRLEASQAAKEAAEASHVATQAELQTLKKYVAELETTKEQLMHDRERFAHNRLRKRDVSKDPQLEGARFSGATLTMDPHSNEQLSQTEPTPALPSQPATGVLSGASDVSKELGTGDSATASTTPSPALPPELKQARRRSLALKTLMRKVTRKDGPKHSLAPSDAISGTAPALTSRSVNLPIRPQTSTAALASQGSAKHHKALGTRPMTAASTETAAMSLARAMGEEPTPGIRVKPLPHGTEIGRPKSAAAGSSARGASATRLDSRAARAVEKEDAGVPGDKENWGGGGAGVDTAKERKPTIRVWSGSGSSKKIVRKSVA